MGRRSDNISECHEINTVLKLTDYWKKSGWGRWATVVLKDIMILDAPAPGIRRNNQPQGTAFNCNFIRGYIRKSPIRNAFISDFKLCQKMRTTRRAAADIRRMAQTSSITVVERRRRMAQREFSSRRDSPVMVRLLEQI